MHDMFYMNKELNMLKAFQKTFFFEIGKTQWAHATKIYKHNPLLSSCIAGAGDKWQGITVALMSRL